VNESRAGGVLIVDRGMVELRLNEENGYFETFYSGNSIVERSVGVVSIYGKVRLKKSAVC
jgi:hypothetical protein